MDAGLTNREERRTADRTDSKLRRFAFAAVTYLEENRVPSDRIREALIDEVGLADADADWVLAEAGRELDDQAAS